ncbi:MAG: type II secretion system protein N [bacterium]|nr:type II secretion system protein N [bacterium]
MAGQTQLVAIAGRVVRVAAVAWMAWVLAGLAWLASGHSGVPLPAPKIVRRAAPAVDVSRLAGLNLFGQPPVATARGEAASAPDTSLQLRLTGVLVNSDASRSSAIVAERNNPAAAARVYRLNDALPGGATLAEVYDDRILIKRGDGAGEVLRFEKTGLLDGGTPPVAGIPAGSEGGAGVRSMLDNAVQAMATAPEQFLQQMGLKRSSAGYEITADTPENLRNAAGLQAGDHLLSINGRRLGDPARDRDVLATLKSSGAAKVEIQRGGQIVTLERKF